MLPPHSREQVIPHRCSWGENVVPRNPWSLAQRTNLSRADGRAPMGLAFSCFCGCCSKLCRTLSWGGEKRGEVRSGRRA